MKYVHILIFLLLASIFVEGTQFIAECANKIWIQNQSDIIVEGTVNKVEGRNIDDITFTFVTINVDKYLKGEGADEIIVRQLGNLEGGPVALSITLEYSIGEKVRLYLEKAEESEYYQTVCGEFGKISLSEKKEEKREYKPRGETNVPERKGLGGLIFNLFDWLRGLFF